MRPVHKTAPGQSVSSLTDGRRRRYWNCYRRSGPVSPYPPVWTGARQDPVPVRDGDALAIGEKTHFSSDSSTVRSKGSHLVTGLQVVTEPRPARFCMNVARRVWAFGHFVEATQQLDPRRGRTIHLDQLASLICGAAATTRKAHIERTTGCLESLGGRPRITCSLVLYCTNIVPYRTN